MDWKTTAVDNYCKVKIGLMTFCMGIHLERSY